MALILQVVAGILMLIGVGTLYSGTNPALLSLGNTIMIVGALFASAGIVLFGLAVVAGQVARLGAKLDILGDLLASGRGREAGPTPVAAPVLPRDIEAMAPLPPDLDLGLTEPPRAASVPAPAALPEPPLRAEPPAAAPPVSAAPPVTATPSPAMPTPPSRQSFGLPPLPAVRPSALPSRALPPGLPRVRSPRALRPAPVPIPRPTSRPPTGLAPRSRLLGTCRRSI